MKNRYTINLFVHKKDDTSRRNFSVELDIYDKKNVEEIVSKKLNLNEEKWSIESSEEIEYIEKERVILWKTVLKRVQ